MIFLLIATAAVLVPLSIVMAALGDWDSLLGLWLASGGFALVVGAARFWRSFLLQPPRWIEPLTRKPWLWYLAGAMLLGFGARALVMREWLVAGLTLGGPVGIALLVVAALYLRTLWWRARRPPKHRDHEAAMALVWRILLRREGPPPTITYKWGVETFWAPMAPYLWRRVYGLTTSPGHAIVAVLNEGVKLSDTAFAHEVIWHCAHGDWGHRRKELEALVEEGRSMMRARGL